MALRRVLEVFALGVAPTLIVLGALGATIGEPTFLYDFRGDLYDAGRAIIHGLDPYRGAFLHHLAAIARQGGAPTQTFAVPVYPAPTLLAAVPLALLPYRMAGVLFTAASIAALAGGLRLLGVRDWRCYGATFLSYPVWHSLRLGQVDGLLILGVALVWRHRAALWRPALATAAVVTAKLFLWPIAVWLLITRRVRTAALAAAVAAAAVLGGWAAIGFAGLTSYPGMLRDLSAVEGGAGVSTVSAGAALGLSRGASGALGLALAGMLLLLAARVGARPRGDGRAFGLAVMAAVVASPVVWPHYLALAFVPIALVSPGFSWLWLVPLLGYAAPSELSHSDLAHIAPYVAIELIITAAVCLLKSNVPVSGRLPNFGPALAHHDR